jgi:hypothetical protein
MPAGLEHVAPFFEESKRLARLALDEMAAKGLFVPRGQTVFSFALHYESTADWTVHLTRPTAGELVADTALLEQARAAMEAGEGAIVVVEPTTASLFERRP